MRLEYFEYLMTLKQHSSMSAASRELHVTPQALSVAIGRLERELGAKLIQTDNQGTQLNENGLFLIDKAQEFFSAIAALKAQKEQDVQATSSTVRVLADPAIKEDFAADLVRRIRDLAPSLTLTIDYCDWDQIEQQFLADAYDLALCYREQVAGMWQSYTEAVHFVPLWRSRLYIVMSSRHPLANCQSVSLQALNKAGIPVVIDRYGESYYKVLTQFAPGLPVMWEDNLVAVQKQVQNNLGVAPDYLSFDGKIVRGVSDGCVARPVTDPISGDLGYLVRRGTLLSAGARAILDHLHQMIAQPDKLQNSAWS